MKFSVSPEIFSNYPGLTVGVLVVNDIDNSGKHNEIIDLLRSTEKEAEQLITPEEVNEHPKIAAVRESHRKFGSNPKKYPPSVQAIVKRVVKGGNLPIINPLVDLYNIISLKHIVPAGGENLDAAEGEIKLTYADGTEEFIELGDTENTPPDEGEVVYKDDKGVICRKFNWREGDRTKLTEDTKNAVLVIEGLPPVTPEEVRIASEELKELIDKYCGGENTVHLLDAESPECEC